MDDLRIVNLRKKRGIFEITSHSGISKCINFKIVRVLFRCDWLDLTDHAENKDHFQLRIVQRLLSKLKTS